MFAWTTNQCPQHGHVIVQDEQWMPQLEPSRSPDIRLMPLLPFGKSPLPWAIVVLLRIVPLPSVELVAATRLELVADTSGRHRAGPNGLSQKSYGKAGAGDDEGEEDSGEEGVARLSGRGGASCDHFLLLF